MTTSDAAGQDDRLADLLGRIERSTNAAAPVPGPLTGRLATLQEWWSGMGGGSEVRPSRVMAPSSPETAAVDALLRGAAEADRAVDSGASLIIPQASRSNEIAALTVIALLTRREANRVVGQPPGMTDGLWMERCAEVRDRSARGVAHLGDQLTLLDALDAPDIAATAGVLLGAAARHTPCLIVGTDVWAAGLVADRMNHVARQWWRPATTSPDPAHQAASDRAGLEPLLPLDLSDDIGLGADAVIALLGLTESVGR